MNKTILLLLLQISYLSSCISPSLIDINIERKVMIHTNYLVKYLISLSQLEYHDYINYESIYDFGVMMENSKKVIYLTDYMSNIDDPILIHSKIQFESDQIYKRVLQGQDTPVYEQLKWYSNDSILNLIDQSFEVEMKEGYNFFGYRFGHEGELISKALKDTTVFLKTREGNYITDFKNKYSIEYDFKNRTAKFTNINAEKDYGSAIIQGNLKEGRYHLIFNKSNGYSFEGWYRNHTLDSASIGYDNSQHRYKKRISYYRRNDTLFTSQGEYTGLQFIEDGFPAESIWLAQTYRYSYEYPSDID